MSYAFVQGRNNTTNTASPATLAYNSNNTAGNLLIITGRGNSGTTAVSISDSQGNTWANFQLNQSSGYRFFMGYALNCKAGANTLTVAGGGGLLTYAIAEYSGVLAFDTQTSAIAGGANPSSGNITTAVANELLIGVIGLTSATTTAGTGFTLRQGGAMSTSCIEDKFTNSAGSNAATFTTTAGGGIGIMAFTPKPSGVPNSLMMMGCGS